MPYCRFLLLAGVAFFAFVSSAETTYRFESGRFAGVPGALEVEFTLSLPLSPNTLYKTIPATFIRGHMRVLYTRLCRACVFEIRNLMVQTDQQGNIAAWFIRGGDKSVPNDLTSELYTMNTLSEKYPVLPGVNGRVASHQVTVVQSPVYTGLPEDPNAGQWTIESSPEGLCAPLLK